MDKKALQLASRFSLPPNSLGYCGKNSAPEKFKACILGGDCDGVEGEISKFIVLYPYLKTLAKITRLSAFSYKVIEGYWIGNDILKTANPEDYKILLRNFLEQGVPDFFVDELKERKPVVFIPNHLFQVLFIGVGRASGAVPFNLESINNCMIRWGRVEKIDNKFLYVNLNSLKKTGNYYTFFKKRGRFPYRNDFLPGLKLGDFIAVHWKQVVKKLTKEEVKKLEYWTKRVITTIHA